MDQYEFQKQIGKGSFGSALLVRHKNEKKNFPTLGKWSSSRVIHLVWNKKTLGWKRGSPHHQERNGCSYTRMMKHHWYLYIFSPVSLLASHCKCREYSRDEMPTELLATSCS